MNTGLVQGISKGIGHYRQHSRNGFIVIVTIGFEELSKFLFFTCPCERPWNKTYGLLFMFGPAFLLWLVGILAQARIFHVILGPGTLARVLMGQFKVSITWLSQNRKDYGCF